MGPLGGGAWGRPCASLPLLFLSILPLQLLLSGAAPALGTQVVINFPNRKLTLFLITASEPPEFSCG